MEEVKWQLKEVVSPSHAQPVPVLAATALPYKSTPNRFQNLSIYLPRTEENESLIGTPARSLPSSQESELPHVLVHVHGGAWRDPKLDSASIEAAVAHAFSSPNGPIHAVASLNYTITHFPTHPELPYDTVQDNRSDPARDGKHPDHVRDVLCGLAHLRSLGLKDGSYILSGHSCGACLVFQACLQSPEHWGISAGEMARPAALLGLNGLYDLPQLVQGLGPSHDPLRDVYQTLLGHAFGSRQEEWQLASPARFDSDAIALRVQNGKIPGLVVLDQSAEDQLVPMNQRDRLATQLRAVSGMRLVLGHRCVGSHAAPWEGGYIIWQSVQDILELLTNEKGEKRS